VLDDERRILGDHPVQHSEIRCSSPRLRGVIATPCIGVGKLERPHVDMILVVRSRAARSRTRSRRPSRPPRCRPAPRCRLDVLAALQHEEVPTLNGLASVADVELRVLGHGALVHAEDAELADERVHDDLEHVREHVLLRIGLRAEFLAASPSPL
jgi:hypothetical protein